MPWPALTDFTSAIYNPKGCFKDPDLVQGEVELHPTWGTPLVYAGTFASVYPVKCGLGEKYAVRCFTNEVSDQQERYKQLTDYLEREKPQGFVEFEYQAQGIKVRGEWYPIVKMEWVEGEGLDKHVQNALTHSTAIKNLVDKWRETAKELHRRDIAHNDLQHGNVMVRQDGSIRLVDYDAFFLPQYRGRNSPEIGHNHYQHPLRTVRDYADYVDNFPALVIYLSLLAIAADTSLWKKFNDGKNLIFEEKDFANPAKSKCFSALKKSPDPTVRQLAAYLEECCARPVSEVPTLEEILKSRQPPKPPGAYPQTPSEKIDPYEFVRFCHSLNGRTLKTLSLGNEFSVEADMNNYALIVTPLSSNTPRNCPVSEVQAFLDHFQNTQSWSTGAYTSRTRNPSYLLAILDLYLKRSPPAQDDLTRKLHETEKALAKARAEADKYCDELQRAQRRLKEALYEAAKAKSETERYQKSFEEAARDTSELLNLLNQLRAEHSQAITEKTEADKKLREVQAKLVAAQRKAAADKDRADRELREAHKQLAAAQHQATADKAKTDKLLQDTQAQLNAARNQSAKRLQDEREARKRAESDKSEMEEKLQADLVKGWYTARIESTDHPFRVRDLGNGETEHFLEAQYTIPAFSVTVSGEYTPEKISHVLIPLARALNIPEVVRDDAAKASWRKYLPQKRRASDYTPLPRMDVLKVLAQLTGKVVRVSISEKERPAGEESKPKLWQVDDVGIWKHFLPPIDASMSIQLAENGNKFSFRKLRGILPD